MVVGLGVLGPLAGTLWALDEGGRVREYLYHGYKGGGEEWVRRSNGQCTFHRRGPETYGISCLIARTSSLCNRLVYIYKYICVCVYVSVSIYLD